VDSPKRRGEINRFKNDPDVVLTRTIKITLITLHNLGWVTVIDRKL